MPRRRSYAQGWGQRACTGPIELNHHTRGTLAAGRGRLWLSRSSPYENRYTANSRNLRVANSHIYGAQTLLFEYAELVFLFLSFSPLSPFPLEQTKGQLDAPSDAQAFGEWEAAVVKARRSLYLQLHASLTTASIEW